MKNLRECVRSAGDVVSTASTTLNAETSDKVSVKYGGSDFGDVFVKDANEPMLRWMASHTVYEYEDMESPFPDPSEASTGEAATEYQSDSDSDIENEMIRSLFNEGKKRKDNGDLAGAVRHFHNCLKRFSSNASYASLTSLQSVSTCGVSKGDLLEQLTDSYCQLGSWAKAKSTMAEKLSITERQVGKKDELYLWDTMKLAELMMKNKEFVGAHLQGRRSLRGFRKLGEPGYKGYERCLTFLIQLCNEDGKADEEDAYAALLGNHKRKLRRSLSRSRAVEDQTLTQPAIAQPPTDVSIHVKNEDQADSKSPATAARSPKESVPDKDTKENTEQTDKPVSAQQHTDASQATDEASDIAKVEAVEATTSAPNTSEQDVTERDFPAPISEPPRHEATNQDTQKMVTPIPDNSEPPKSLPHETGSIPKLTTGHGVGLSENQHSNIPGKLETTSQYQTPVAPAVTSNLNKAENQNIQPPSEFQKEWLKFRQHNSPAVVPMPSTVSHYFNKLYSAAGQVFSEKRALTSHEKNLDLLTAYCNYFHNSTPQFFHHTEIWGHAYTVKINGKNGCSVSGQSSKNQAKDAVTAKACEMFISAADEQFLLGEDYQQKDPYSDKEVYYPEIDRQEFKEVVTASYWDLLPPLEAGAVSDQSVPGPTLAGVPHITISSDDNGNASTVQGKQPVESNSSVSGPSVRRSVSDSNMHSRSAVDEIYASGTLASSIDAELTRLKESRSHRRGVSFSGISQDMLEWTPGDDQSFGGPAIKDHDPSCPMCGKSLAGLSEDAVSIHVNGCIDAAPVEEVGEEQVQQEPKSPLSPSQLSWSQFIQVVESPGSLKGSWACSRCKSATLQPMTDNKCHSCKRERDFRSPSSLNDFRREALDRHQTGLSSVNMDLLVTANGSAVRRKVVLLGDALCGKTFLANAWCYGLTPSPETETPLVNNFVKHVDIEGRQVELIVWDNTGMDDYTRLRRLSYEDVHVVVICFDISNPDSLENVEEMVSLLLHPLCHVHC